MSQTAAITSQTGATKITNTEKKQKENKPEVEKNPTEMMSNGGTAEQEQEFLDPFCNADNPQIITFQDVTSAAFKIKKGIEYTPCPVRRENSLTALPSSPHPTVDGFLNGSLRVLINEALINTNWRFYWNSFFFSIYQRSHLSEMIDMDIYLKKEFLQFTGSFKERGARYALIMLTAEQKKKGVISASLGNHAQVRY